jgi:hypothetical protein
MKFQFYIFAILAMFVMAIVPGCTTSRDAQQDNTPTVGGSISTGVGGHF